MPESSRFVFDSKGRSHYVYDQQYSMSCGPACVAMTEHYYRNLCMISPEGRAQVLSQRYPGSFDLKTGTLTENLYYVLCKEGVKAYSPITVPQGKIFDYLHQYVGDKTPAIVLVKWASGGGHFAVCRMIDTDQTVIFLDPIYGVVEVARKDLPMYHGSGQIAEAIFTHR